MPRVGKLAAAGLAVLLVGLAVGYFLGRMADRDPQEDDRRAASATGTETSNDIPLDIVAIRRDAIEAAYPEFRDFENQESFAGHSIRVDVETGDYYIAYIVHGSGMPIAQATCFRVDRINRVFQLGVFPDPLESFNGYRDLNPRTCRGIE